MDIGMNLGTMTTNMLKAGARVTSIEPQRDLAQLGWATACLNQWDDRLTLYGNAVTHTAAAAGTVLELGNREKAGEWGFRPDGSHLKATAKTLQATKVFLEQVVGQTKQWAFVKIDTDAIDDELTASWMQARHTSSLPTHVAIHRITRRRLADDRSREGGSHDLSGRVPQSGGRARDAVATRLLDVHHSEPTYCFQT
jgi:FkbM family methyltransferase